MSTSTRIAIDPLGRDIPAESARLRALGPVVPVELPGGIPAWAPTGYDTLRSLILDPRVSRDPRAHWSLWPEVGRNPAWGWILGWLGAINMITSYGPDHRRLRKLVAPSFTARRTEAMRLRVSIWAGDFDWSGAFDATAVPAAMFVNWIQTYSYTPGGGPGGTDFTPLWRDELNATDSSRWYWANWTFDAAVNDYVQQNSTTRNGYLVQVLTADTATGQFPAPPVDDGSIAQPPPVDTTPVAIPARIEAEDYTRFIDTSSGNFGDAVCSHTDVDAQLTSDPTGGHCNIGWTAPGEWLEYNVTTASAAPVIAGLG